ncbi:MAG: hypothetical protein ACOY42_02000 [Pseudomonadota bacterium]
MAAVSLPASMRPLSVAATVDADWGILLDYADDGTLHRRELNSREFYRLNASWELLTVAERDALMGFLRGRRMEQVALDAGGYRYTVELIEGPREELRSATRFDVSAVFRGTRALIVDPVATIIAAYAKPSVWYDPSDLSTMWQDTAGTVPAVIGLPVARIDDKGNLALNAMQATAAARPILLRDSGGRYYLQYDGSDDALIIPTGMPVPTTGLFAALAFLPTSLPGPSSVMYWQRGTAFDVSHQHPFLHVSNNGAFSAVLGNESVNSTVGSISLNTAYVGSLRMDTANAERRGYLNSILCGTASTTSAQSNAGDNPTGGLGFTTFAGRIYGLVNIQHGISDADRIVIERELMRKAGLV